MLPPESLLVDLFRAYYDARRNKRNTHAQLACEIDYESQIMQLYDELMMGTYTISTSICFLMCDTVPREVFAASFRDRIIHHLLYNYIYQICDAQFVTNSYSCREGKGTHYGVKSLDHHIRSCSHNYTRDCYVLKLDIKGFFMHIDKERLRYILWQMAMPKLRSRHGDEVALWIWAMLTQVIMHDPTCDYTFQGSRGLYDVLPADKSLFSSPHGVGLPIGNLTSQLFANVYMHPFDRRIQYDVGVRHYGRYVDDFYMVHMDKQYLRELIESIASYLQSELGLTLHPRKIYLQHYTKGVTFLGVHVKPHRKYINRTTLGRAKKALYAIQCAGATGGGAEGSARCGNGKPVGFPLDIATQRATINSYLGMLRHTASYRQRSKLTAMVSEHFTTLPPFISVTPHGTSISPPDL